MATLIICLQVTVETKTVLLVFRKERPYLFQDLKLILKVACKPPIYKCKSAVYTCKLLKFMFTCVLLITLLDTVEVTPFFKLVVYTCKPLWFALVNLLKLRFTCFLLIIWGYCGGDAFLVFHLLKDLTWPRPKPHVKIPCKPPIYKYKLPIYSKLVVYKCKLVVYKYKPLIYTYNLQQS